MDYSAIGAAAASGQNYRGPYDRHQAISRTDVISEGPISGLVNGQASVYLDNDRAMPLSMGENIGAENHIDGPINITISSGNQVASVGNAISLAPFGSYDNTTNPSIKKYLLVRGGTTPTSFAVQLTSEKRELWFQQDIVNEIKGVGNNANQAIFTDDIVPGSSAVETFTSFRQARLTPRTEAVTTTNSSVNSEEQQALFDELGGTIAEGYLHSASSNDKEANFHWGAPTASSNGGRSLPTGLYTLEVDKVYEIASISGTNITFIGTPVAGTFDFEISGGILDETAPYGSTDSVHSSIQTSYEGTTVQFRTGTLNQSPFTGQGGDGSTSISNVPSGGASGALELNSAKEIVSGGTGLGLSTTQRQEVDEVILRVSYTAHHGIGGGGDTTSQKSEYKVEIALKEPGANDFSAYTVHKARWAHIAAEKNACTFELIVDMEKFRPFADFKFRITRLTDHQGFPYHYNDNTKRYRSGQLVVPGQLGPQTSILKEKLNHPFTAMGKVTWNSKNFPQMPSLTYHCRGLLVKVPSNYVTREQNGTTLATYNRNIVTGVIETTPQDWDGAFRSKLTYTNNPAWIFYDIITNNRYGLGEFLSETEIDKYTLYKIARYCDERVTGAKGELEPRFTCNVYLMKSTDAYKVLKDLATAFRGMLYSIDGQITPTFDAPASSVYNFSQGNVVEGKFSYETTGTKTRANQYLVGWNDPEYDYEGRTLIVEDSENIAKNNGRIISEAAIAFGATSEGQAERYGRWKLWTSTNQTEVVTFDTSLNGSFLQPGDIITISDAERSAVRHGGRVSATGTRSTTQVPLDSNVTFSAGSTNTLSLLFIKKTAYYRGTANVSINSVTYKSGDIIEQAYIDGTQVTVAADVSDDDTVYITETNASVSANHSVKGTNISGTVTVSSISGKTITLSSNQNLSKGDVLLINKNGTYTLQDINTEEDSLNAKSSNSATEFLQLDWNDHIRTETKDLPNNLAGTTVSAITVTNANAFSVAPTAETMWVISSKTAEGLTTTSSGKDYKILVIAEKSNNILEISAVEFYNEKFKSVDNDFKTYVSDSVYVPITSNSIVPPPREVLAFSDGGTAGKNENVTLTWLHAAAEAGTTSSIYEHLTGYEIIHNLPGNSSILRKGKNVTSVLFKDLLPGRYRFSVRTINTLGNKSEAIPTDIILEEKFNDSTPRFPEGVMYGGRINTSNKTVTTTSGGSITAVTAGFPSSVFTFQPPNSGGSLISSTSAGGAAATFTQNILNMPAISYTPTNSGAFIPEHFYILIDASDSSDRLKLLRYTQNSDGVNWWYNAGTGNTGTTTQSYSQNVARAANSTKITGTGTSFTTLLHTGMPFIATNTAGDSEAARVASIESDTVLFLDRALASTLSASSWATSNFKIDLLQDCIIARAYRGSNAPAGYNYYPYTTLDSTLTGQTIDRVPIYFFVASANTSGTGTPGSAPSTPSGGTFESPLDGVASGWALAPTSVNNPGDTVYVAKRLFTSDGLTPQEANWSAPALYAINKRGADGSPGGAGATGKRSTTGLLYYQNSIANADGSLSAPSNSNVSFNFNTGVMSGGVIGTGSTNWNIFAPTNTAGAASSKTWYVTFNVVETTAGGGTGQPTFDSTVRNATNFTGLVVFNTANNGFEDGSGTTLVPVTSMSSLQNDAGEKNIVTTMINTATTVINGGRIDTGTITADQIGANEITAAKLQISTTPAADGSIPNSSIFFDSTSGNNAIEIRDASGVIRVKIGKL